VLGEQCFGGAPRSGFFHDVSPLVFASFVGST
jgi:hypothetical protein